MDINLLSDTNVKFDSGHSNSTLKRKWDQAFWNEQNMQAVSHNGKESSMTRPDVDIQRNESVQKTEQAIRAQSAAVKETGALSILGSNQTSAFGEASGASTDVIAQGLVTGVASRSSVSDAYRAMNPKAGAQRSAELMQEELRTGLIQKKDRDVKLWTSKVGDESNWKQSLIKGFEFFGLNLKKLVVRGREY